MISYNRCYGLNTALNDFSVLNQKSLQGIQIKMRGSKEFLFILFFSANFMCSFHKDHVGNFDTWLSLEERNLKQIIWMSTSQSVPREMQKDMYTKNWLKNFYHITIFEKHGLINFVNHWPHTVDTPTEGSSVWGKRLSSDVIKCYCYYNIKELKCSYKDTLIYRFSQG